MPKHVIDTRQFKRREFINGFLKSTQQMREAESRPESRRLLRYSHPDSIVCGLFYEPSTRTRMSFESAALKLGARTTFTENAADFSSAHKGERLEHSVRATQSNYDMLVIRHPEAGSALRAAAVSEKPVVNAGDGNNQHPTQALLDIYTIYEKFGTIDGLKIGFLGDIRNGRTIRSLAYLLGHRDGNEFYFASPSSLSVPDDMVSYLSEKSVRIEQTKNVRDFLGCVDVLYVTRIQQERLDRLEYEDVLRDYGRFVIDAEKAGMMKDGSIIMHPLPINTEKSNGNPEIRLEVDGHPRAGYFAQSNNGVYARMALLDILLSGERDPLYGLIADYDAI